MAFKQFQDTNHNVVDVAESRGFELLGVVQTAGPVDSNIATLCVTLICIKVRLYTTTSNVSSSLLQQNKTKHIITTAEKRPHETIPTKNPPPPTPIGGRRVTKSVLSSLQVNNRRVYSAYSLTAACSDAPFKSQVERHKNCSR